MLKVDCQICKDPLGGPDRHPVAMPCGHMYCEDCATFWFNSGENKKCFCGKAFKGDQIVRLWTESAEGGSDGAHEEKEKGKEKENLEEECKAELAEGGDGAVVLALQRVQKTVEGIALEPEEAGVKNVLRDVRHALQSIKDTLTPKPPSQPAPAPAPQQPDAATTAQLHTAQRALRAAAQQLAHERAYAHAQTSGFRQQIADLTSRVKELEERCGELEEYRARERERRDRMRGLERENEVLVGRVESATKSVTRWRKKYYAMKQAAAQKTRPQAAVGNGDVVEDDSLIILD